MAIRKINSGIQPAFKQNDITELAKLFPRGFSYFFMPLLPPKNMNESEAFYVPNENMESQIYEAFSGDESSVSILIGEKGSGKSTLIRHCLKMSANQVKIEKNTIFLFNVFNCRPPHSMFPFHIENRIGSVNAKLEESYPKLSEYFYSLQGQKQFYDFTEKTHADILQYTKANLLEPLSPSRQEAMALEHARKHVSAVYEALKLQFLLTSSLCPIQRLVISIDGIDEFTPCQIEEILCAFITLYKQLNSFPQDKMPKYCTVNLLISLQPASYRSLYQARRRQAWPVNRVIIMNTFFNLEKYFSRRLRRYSQKSSAQNAEVWRKCQQQLGLICQKFGGKYDSMIWNLSFHSVPEALKLYAKILCNQTWMRQGQRDSDNDWFNSETYILNNISVIRAISCGDNEIFVNTPESHVSNLLYNTPDKDYSILCLYIIALFKRHLDTDEVYGSDFLVLGNVISFFQDLFPTIPDISADVHTSLKYLYSRKILVKSYTDILVPESHREPDSLWEHSRLYLSSKGKELWNMLQADSVLMEICREDYYRTYDTEGCFNNRYSSYVLMEDQQDELFIDSCRILSSLITLEETYIEDARKNQTVCLLTEALGPEMMCSYLMQGIKKSMEYSGLIRQPNVYEAFAQVNEKLHAL